MHKILWSIIAILLAVGIFWWRAEAHDMELKRPFGVFVSGGNCVYVGNFGGTSVDIEVVPRPTAGC